MPELSPYDQLFAGVCLYLPVDTGGVIRSLSGRTLPKAGRATAGGSIAAVPSADAVLWKQVASDRSEKIRTCAAGSGSNVAVPKDCLWSLRFCDMPSRDAVRSHCLWAIPLSPDSD